MRCGLFLFKKYQPPLSKHSTFSYKVALFANVKYMKVRYTFKVAVWIEGQYFLDKKYIGISFKLYTILKNQLWRIIFKRAWPSVHVPYELM